MKAIFHGYAWLFSGTFVGLLAVCSMGVHPYGSLKQVEGQLSPDSDLHLSPNVRAVLNRSCMDCHSNQTAWPWYSYVAPMSWVIEKDVRDGRDRLNLSEWHEYTFQQQRQLLADIATAVENGEMPLAKYTMVHRGARLSQAERDLVYGWARIERRRIRAGLAVVPTSSDQPTQNR